MRLVLSIALALVVAGCSQVSSLPPDSQITVSEAYEASTRGADVAVVVGAVEVTDEAVGTHIGPGDLDDVYRTFFVGQLPAAFETADVGEVRVFLAEAVGAEDSDPAALAFPAYEPDLVLVLDTLHVGRAVYYNRQMGPAGMGGPTQITSSTTALRIDTEILLYDRARGAEVATGALDTERTLGPVGRGRGVYEDAVREFVEQLARFTPIALRED